LKHGNQIGTEERDEDGRRRNGGGKIKKPRR